MAPVRQLWRHCWVAAIGMIVGCGDLTSPAPSITTGSPLPSGIRGQSYSQTLAATGGDGTNYAWSVISGRLPGGLALSSAGVLSGTPSAAGTSTFTVQVSSGGQTASKDFSLTINHPPVSITSISPLPSGTLGQSYSHTLAATGGDGTNYAWSVTSGSLPAGLALSTSGVLSGTPSAAGTSTFTVYVSSGGRADSRQFNLTIMPPPELFAVTRSGPLGAEDCDALWLVAVGQKYEKQLTTCGEKWFQDLWASWSPDGAKIAFSSNREGVAIWVMNWDGTDQRRLQNGQYYSSFPAWSPDGNRIAFLYISDGRTGIAVMDPDGANVTKLTSYPCPQICRIGSGPSWSPDGARIAFVSPQGGLYTMNADGSAPSLLTDLRAAGPAWSPDGTLIAFYGGANWDIFVISPDGQNLTNLTNTADKFEGSLTWSPDGRRIAFLAGGFGTGTPELWIMNADGSNKTMVYQGVGSFGIAWRPYSRH